ncbi:MAG: FAD-binding protein [Gemmatimonadota bacterium]|nr:FAD-binding protein [Gemmatimonadota bacterium]
MPVQNDADLIVVGAGLAGLIAAAEAADLGRTVLLIDQEGEQSLGGQAFWSFGGLFFVDSPEQRRLGIHDSRESRAPLLAGRQTGSRSRIHAHRSSGVRKSLGGLETDLGARVLRADGQPMPGLYAAGDVAGFGGGGVHGYRSLEGPFLGGCLFSGRVAGRTAAAEL